MVRCAQTSLGLFRFPALPLWDGSRHFSKSDLRLPGSCEAPHPADHSRCCSFHLRALTGPAGSRMPLGRETATEEQSKGCVFSKL